jgi:hypothetical protein
MTVHISKGNSITSAMVNLFHRPLSLVGLPVVIATQETQHMIYRILYFGKHSQREVA